MDEESHALRGELDQTALSTFASVVETDEPLAECAFDDFINPTELQIHLTDGIGEADSARIDVEWSKEQDYNLHYTDSLGRNLRWDLHPHSYSRPSGDGHFHPPPEASTDDDDVEDSCIRVIRVKLVARAMLDRWRDAYEQNSFEGINEAENPP